MLAVPQVSLGVVATRDQQARLANALTALKYLAIGGGVLFLIIALRGRD